MPLRKRNSDRYREPQQRFTKNRKLDFTRYALCTVYHSTSSQLYVHKLAYCRPVWICWPSECENEFTKYCICIVLYLKTINFANITGSLTFTLAPSRTRSQKAAQLLQFFTARCYTSAALAMALCPSVCLSVCPSVCPSVRHKSEFY